MTSILALTPHLGVNITTFSNTAWNGTFPFQVAGAAAGYPGPSNVGLGSVTVTSVAPQSPLGTHQVEVVEAVEGEAPRFTVHAPNGTTTGIGRLGVALVAGGIGFTLMAGARPLVVGDTFLIGVTPAPLDVTEWDFALMLRRETDLDTVCLSASTTSGTIANGGVAGQAGMRVQLATMRTLAARHIPLRPDRLRRRLRRARLCRHRPARAGHHRPRPLTEASMPFDSDAGTFLVPGPSGASAYEAWRGLGNTGTVADFLATLVGAPGKDSQVAGPEGKQGPAGAGAVAVRTASAAIVAWTAMIADGPTNCVPAESTNPAHRGLVIGITAFGGAAGASVEIENTGDLSGPARGFAAESVLFVGASGALVTSPPTTWHGDRRSRRSSRTDTSSWP